MKEYIEIATLTNFNHRHFLKLLFFCILPYSPMVSTIRESYRYLLFFKYYGTSLVVFPQKQISVTRRIARRGIRLLRKPCKSLKYETVCPKRENKRTAYGRLHFGTFRVSSVDKTYQKQTPFCQNPCLHQ